MTIAGQAGSPEPGSRQINPGEMADKVAVVVVDGETIEVPYGELIAGYSRQSDYTKKAQAVADERKALEQERATQQNAVTLYERLQQDPEGTVKILNQQLGVTGHQAEPTTQDDGYGGEPLEPEEQELANLRAQQQAQADEIRRLQARLNVDSEAKQLETKYPELEINQVIAYAAQHKFPEGGLESAYKAMMCEKSLENPEGQGEPEPATAEPPSALDQLLEAKRMIPNPPISRTTDQQAEPSTGSPFLDAWRDSERELS